MDDYEDSSTVSIDDARQMLIEAVNKTFDKWEGVKSCEECSQPDREFCEFDMRGQEDLIMGLTLTIVDTLYVSSQYFTSLRTGQPVRPVLQRAMVKMTLASLAASDAVRQMTGKGAMLEEFLKIIKSGFYPNSKAGFNFDELLEDGVSED